MSAAHKEKCIIRKEVIARRDALSIIIRKAKDESIKRRLLALPEFIKARTILFYASFRSEVGTLQLLQDSLLNNKTVVLPKVDMQYAGLKLYEIRAMEDLAPGCYGILEPPANEDRSMHDAFIDLMIIPGVAFDEHFNRIGYGKGFYDRLLSHKKAPAIALAYEEQVIAHIPTDEHDIKMDKIVTDKRIIQPHGQ
ncbi:MAG TPA: 5-formyltetrahydrofolate cyclo-ligase [Dissulfurispiraceae bacterium]|nr:5-formyltetrahydrofolate cyclo-ligase [Dissulfurispiraceae bacterium]